MRRHDNLWQLWQFLTTLTISDNFDYFWKVWQFLTTLTILKTCDFWDTDYNSDNWEPEFMTFFVTWQSRVTLDSIRNSCNVCLQNLLKKSLPTVVLYFQDVKALNCTWLNNFWNYSFWDSDEEKFKVFRIDIPTLTLISSENLGWDLFGRYIPIWLVKCGPTKQNRRKLVTATTTAKCRRLNWDLKNFFLNLQNSKT